MHDDLIREAVELLRRGQLVSFPTETVYGLGADARSKDAIKRLYMAKGRPSSHPVIVHLHSLDAVSDWAVNIPDTFYKLAEAFWPGPLTMVLKRDPSVLDEVTGGQNTVAIRMPDHPLALALLKEFGGGLVAPSANKFGRLSPTSAQHVRDEFSSEVALVLDGGACDVGIESTIVDLSNETPRILRPGMLSAAEISEVIGTVAVGSVSQNSNVRVPGSLKSHYSPTTPMHLVASHTFFAFIQDKLREAQSVAVISFEPPVEGFTKDKWKTMSRDPYQFAREIYGCLRELDRSDTQLIVVESPPTADLIWSGIQDRLTRAAQR